MRSKYAAFNFIASTFRSGVGVVLGLFTTPIILKYLGEEQFGIFRILLDWFSHLSLFEFGLYGAALSFLTKIIAEKNHKIGAAFQVLFAKYTKVFFIQIAVLVIFAIFIDSIVVVSDEYKSVTFWSFCVMSVGALFIYSQIFRAFLDASQKGFYVSYILMAQNIIYLVISLILVYYSNFGLIGQVAAYVVSLFLMLFVYAYICRKEILSMWNREILVYEDLNTLKNQRRSLFFNDLFSRASLLSDNLVITFILGAKSVMAFYLTQKLAQIFQQQLQYISHSSWPAIGELYYKEEYPTLQKRIVQLSELTACFAGISLSTLVLTNKNFMILWTGEHTYSGDLTTYLACVNAGFFALTSLWGWSLTAINRSDLSVPIYFIQAIVNIVSSFVFTYMIGVNGPLIGSFLGLAIVTFFWMSRTVATVFRIEYKEILLKSSKSFLIPVTLAISIHQYIHMPLMKNWLQFFLIFSSIFLIVTCVVYFVLITKDTKGIFLSTVKKVILRKF